MEETFGGCRSATTNESHYTNGLQTSQENLHCEIDDHDVKLSTNLATHEISLSNQQVTFVIRRAGTHASRVKPLKLTGKSSPRVPFLP
ncbi:hypothetical protein C6T60_00770 [Burkholderia multivorans]|nr:hypothetical protein C6T60_00770 [Burkholderia multivorans]